MAKVAIITSYFPYGTPEQFFEAELPLWAASEHEVTLLPMRSTGPARPVPDGIAVDTSLAVLDTWRRRGTPANLLRACLDASTWREVIGVVRRQGFTVRAVAEIISTEAQVLLLRKRIEDLVARGPGYDVMYSYWHGTAAYAAGAAAANGANIGSTVARAHRVDVDEESRPSGHYPRKRHYQAAIDVHAPISDAGANYLVETYAIDPSRILVSRLGCRVTGQRTSTSPDGEYRILSSSFVTPLKRVDAIHRAVLSVADTLPELQVSWTHLGSGAEFDEVQHAAERHKKKNLTVDLAGQIPHHQVLEHLATEPVDVFVNFSQIEGVPVSIMEAMAGGVPAVAPAVGGISEILDESVGRLLSTNPTEDDLAAALLSVREDSKSESMRCAAAALVGATYNADANFQEFINRITSCHQD